MDSELGTASDKILHGWLRALLQNHVSVAYGAGLWHVECYRIPGLAFVRHSSSQKVVGL
jgi:hypothetical protein